MKNNLSLLALILFLNIIPCTLHSQPIEVSEKDAENMLTILQQDVFQYFSIGDMTDLQKKNFLKSSDGKSLVDSMKFLKKELLKERYVTIVKNQNLGEYDVQKKGFVITFEIESSLGYNYAWEEEYYRNEFFPKRNSINGFWFPSLPIKTYRNLYFRGVKEMFIKCDEKNAGLLEKKDVDISFQFNLSDKVEKQRKINIVYVTSVLYPSAKNVIVTIILNGDEYLKTKYK